MSWYDLDSNVARVSTNEARIYSIKQCLSRFEHDLQTIFIRLFYGSKYGLRPSTIKHDVNTIYWTFTGFINGPIDFCSIRFIYDFDTVELTRALCFMYGCIYGLVRAHTVSHGLVRSLIRLYTDIAPVPVF